MASNTDISDRLARAMGWERQDDFGYGQTWVKGEDIMAMANAEYPGEHEFSPDVSWEDIGICVKWAQKKYGPFETETVETEDYDHLRISRFGTGDYYQDSRSFHVTPLHIAETILFTVEGTV